MTGTCVRSTTPVVTGHAAEALRIAAPLMISATWGFVIQELVTALQNSAPYNGDPCDDGNPGTADDTCSNGVCTGNPVGAAIPTLSEWGMIIFMTIILGIGVVVLVRRRSV